MNLLPNKRSASSPVEHVGATKLSKFGFGENCGTRRSSIAQQIDVLSLCDDEVSSSSEVIAKLSTTPVRPLDAFVFRQIRSDFDTESDSTTTSSLTLCKTGGDNVDAVECDFGEIISCFTDVVTSTPGVSDSKLAESSGMN